MPEPIDFASYVDFLKNAAAMERKAIFLRIGYTCAIVLVGIGVILFAEFVPAELIGPEQKGPFRIGGGIVSVLAGFPFNGIFSRKAKINALDWLCRQFESAKLAYERNQVINIDSLQEYFLKVIDKALGVPNG